MLKQTVQRPWLQRPCSAIKFLLRQQPGVPVETVKQIMLSVRMEVLKRAVDCYHRQGQPPQLRALLEIGSKQLLLKILQHLPELQHRALELVKLVTISLTYRNMFFCKEKCFDLSFLIAFCVSGAFSFPHLCSELCCFT